MTPAQRQEAFFRKAGPLAKDLVALMDSLPQVHFYVTDAAGRIMAINSRNCEHCNLRTQEEAIGRPYDELFPRLFARYYDEVDGKVRRFGKPTVGLISFRPADKSALPVVSSIFPFRTPSGKIIGTMCVYYQAGDDWSSPVWLNPVCDAVRYIKDHYAENIAIPHLAHLCKTSVPKFRRLFTQIIGLPPDRYITTIRLKEARRLLETTDRKISEIATEVGFFDQSHFIKVFTKSRGLTPGRYRKLHWEQAYSRAKTVGSNQSPGLKNARQKKGRVVS